MLERDIFFYHIMKTAGTTVVRLLEDAFGAEASCPLPTHAGADETAFLQKITHQGPLVVSGHPDQLFHLWERAHDRAQPRATMTFLRHPVDRYLSCYHFLTRSNYVQTRVKQFDMTLEQSLESDEPRLADNVMTKALASLGAPRDYTAPARPEDLALAVRHLRQFDFTGLLHEFETSYALLAWKFGFAPGVITRWNVNRKYPQRDELDRELARRITRRNIYDMELYNFGLELFRLQVAEAGEELAPLLAAIRTSGVTYMVRQAHKE